MEYFATSGTPARQRTACAVIGIYDNNQFSAATRAMDEASGGAVKAAVARGDISGKPGRTLMLHGVAGIGCDRLLIVGCGKKSEFDLRAYRRCVAAAAAQILNTGAASAIIFLNRTEVPGADAYLLARHAVAMVEDAKYRFTAMKSGKKPPAPKLRRVGLGVAARRDISHAERGARDAAGIAAGSKIARDLGNLPANVCTPSYLAREARRLAKKSSRLQTRVVNEAEMKRLGMGSLLSVTAGSVEPAKLIVMEYRGAARSEKPFVLVGKGITFDTGGISIKPAAAMDEMKFDMCGAASVFGAMTAVVELGLTINLVCLVPTCENMPGGDATKPGDIVTTMSGKTVEILNTDAEGRLILCDALTYARRFKPRSVIDIATLTGACVIALGDQFSGLLSDDDELTAALIAAGEKTEDVAWRLPLREEYTRLLDSNFADIANVGGRAAGTITAACFLWQFAKGMSWAHLDIAGTAWKSGKEKGATGRPVSLLVQYLLDNA